MRVLYFEEGMELPDVFDAGEDHGFGWFDGGAGWRRHPLFQSAMLSLLVHFMVISTFAVIPRDVENRQSLCLEVQLVSLGAGMTAVGSGGVNSGEESPAAGTPALSNRPTAALLAAAPPPLGEAPEEKAPKPPVTPAATRPRPANKPKDPPKTPAAQRETRIAESPAAAPPQPAEAGAAGRAAPLLAQGDSEEGGAGAAMGAHGKGLRGGYGGGPVDAEFGVGNGPRFARKSLPQYPRLARQLGKEGTVVLRVTIDESGRPIAVETLKSAGSDFDEEAKKAIKASHFHPAQREGRPVTCRAMLPIRFRLSGSD